MKNFILKILALLFLSFSCTTNSWGQAGKDEYTFYTSPSKQFLAGNDHVSEGFLAPLNDGKILLLFRLDPGIEGDHVGTNAYIAIITYDPEKDSWSKVETVGLLRKAESSPSFGGLMETKQKADILFTVMTMVLLGLNLNNQRLGLIRN